MKTYQRNTRRPGIRSVAVALLASLLALFLFAGCEEDEDDEPSAPSGDFVYVMSAGASVIDGYFMDSETGALGELSGSPFSGYQNIVEMTASRGATQLFLIRDFSTNVDVIVKNLDSGTGTLKGVAGGIYNIASFMGSAGVHAHPSADFVYATETFNDEVHRFTLDVDSGALTENTAYGLTFNPVSTAITPSGEFFYGVDPVGGYLHGFSVNAGSGALAVLSPAFVSVSALPQRAAMDPLGEMMMVWDSTVGNVYPVLIAADGGLGVQTVQPLTISSFAEAFDPSGSYYYLVDNAMLHGYSVNRANGTLTALDGTPFDIGTTPNRLAFSSNGNFLLVTDSANSFVHVFDISAGGIPDAVPGSPFDTSANPAAMLVVNAESEG